MSWATPAMARPIAAIRWEAAPPRPRRRRARAAPAVVPNDARAPRSPAVKLSGGRSDQSARSRPEGSSGVEGTRTSVAKGPSGRPTTSGPCEASACSTSSDRTGRSDPSSGRTDRVTKPSPRPRPIIAAAPPPPRSRSAPSSRVSSSSSSAAARSGAGSKGREVGTAGAGASTARRPSVSTTVRRGNVATRPESGPRTTVSPGRSAFSSGGGRSLTRIVACPRGSRSGPSGVVRMTAAEETSPGTSTEPGPEPPRRISSPRRRCRTAPSSVSRMSSVSSPMSGA
jgi:hypothetical protein